MTRAPDGRIEEVYNAALARQTSADALARFDTYVAPYTPQTVILSIGTNAVGQGFTQASWQASLIVYRDSAQLSRRG